MTLKPADNSNHDPGVDSNPLILEGERIRLRKARESDWSSMLRNVWGDEAVYRWMLYQPTLTEEGVYVLQGSAKEVTVTVQAGDQDKVQSKEKAERADRDASDGDRRRRCFRRARTADA